MCAITEGYQETELLIMGVTDLLIDPLIFHIKLKTVLESTYYLLTHGAEPF
jgi:hypothetical protein